MKPRIGLAFLIFIFVKKLLRSYTFATCFLVFLAFIEDILAIWKPGDTKKAKEDSIEKFSRCNLSITRFFISNQVAKGLSNVKNGIKVKQLAKQPPTLKTLIEKILV